MNPSPHDLRSPAEMIGGIVYLGRMIDKIRLQSAGRLPDDLRDNLGKGFDERCARFFRIDYPEFAEQVRSGASDQELLEWCFANGRRPEEDDVEVWNSFMRKQLVQPGCQ